MRLLTWLYKNSSPPVSTIRWTHTQAQRTAYCLADIYISSPSEAEKRQPRDRVRLRWLPSNISNDCNGFKFSRFAVASARYSNQAEKVSQFKAKSAKKIIQTGGKVHFFKEIWQVFFFSKFCPWTHPTPTPPVFAVHIVNNSCLLSRPFRPTIHQICSHVWLNKTITWKPFTTVMDSRSEKEACFLQRDHFNGKQNCGRTRFPMRGGWISLYKFYENNPSKCLRKENLLKTEYRQTYRLRRFPSFLRFSFKAALKRLHKGP